MSTFTIGAGQSARMIVMGLLEGKHALITGGTTGLGLAVASASWPRVPGR